MKYENVILAEFRARLNRFAATVWTDGGEVTVHVKNTGRLRELLLPGAQVALTPGSGSDRKTGGRGLRAPAAGFIMAVMQL